ncbi:MAG: hypothetical protein KF810_18150 [Rhizobiaceae bacterium]|nr:hypothetical protein [Rhizobiaceae bacterium]
MPNYTPQDWYWIVNGDGSRYWSSAARAYVTEIAGSGGVSPIASEAELDDVLAPYGLLGPTARRKVRKSVVQARLIDAGKMDAAYAALTSNPTSFARWFAPDHPEVYADDQGAVALLGSIGADVGAIMAPGEA